MEKSLNELIDDTKKNRISKNETSKSKKNIKYF